MSFSDAIREAASSSLGVLTRDAALRKTHGFAEAWETAQSVPGWFDEVSAATFWGVISDVRPHTVVEIGSYLGRSTCLMGLALKQFGTDPELIAIDPHTGDRQNLEGLGVDTIPTLDLFRVYTAGAGIRDLLDERVMLSDDAAKGWDGRAIDFLFVDGWHSYDAVVNDARNFASLLGPNGVVCFDDYGSYEDVRAAVRDACRELGLHLYGVIRRKAWAGRRPEAPPSLHRALRITRPLRVLERGRS
jgi:predicted O-methyltransferase YrrM